jgi:hypothetical protein
MNAGVGLGVTDFPAGPAGAQPSMRFFTKLLPSLSNMVTQKQFRGFNGQNGHMGNLVGGKQVKRQRRSKKV